MPVGIGDRPEGEAVVGSLYCGGEFVRNVWIGPGNTVDVDAEARRVAERWVGSVPVPAVSIGTAPPGESVTGLATWFWVEGYRGAPVSEQLDAFGYPVEVRMEPSAVTWTFGDGTTSEGGFGQAYPAQSDVIHAYEQRSTSASGPNAPLQVRLRFEMRPAYRVDRGPWQPLDPIAVAHQQPLVVREIQAVITDQ
jgi:hypothetical protein